MVRFLRRTLGLALLLAGLFLAARHGVAAYASVLREPVPAAVTRPCAVYDWAGVEVQSRCAGSWTPAGGTPVSGQVYGSGDDVVGTSAPVSAFGRYAFVEPVGTDRRLGLASVPALLLGLVLFTRRRPWWGGRRRSRRAVRGAAPLSRTAAGGRTGWWGGDSDSDSHSDYDGRHDSDSGSYDGGSGGDGGGGGGDGGGGGGD